MSGEPTKRNLGRGLSALLGGGDGAEVTALDRGRAPRTVPVEFLHPGAFQPRKHFDEAELAALAESIRVNGILQPLLVRRHPKCANEYEIIAGERRWRAAQIAQLHEAPVVVRELDDRAALELALVENVQREDLSPLEEADGYRRLMDEFGNTQEDLARRVGKSRSHLANMLRLLNLPAAVKELLESGVLSAGHARALLNAEQPLVIARVVVARGLNVRQTEQLVRAQKAAPAPAAAPARDADTVALERELSSLLGLKVSIAAKGQSGALTVQYKTLEQLDGLLHRLGQSGDRQPGS